MTREIDEAIERYTSNAEYERTHGNLQGCLEFRQLAEWLRDYKRLKEQEPCEDTISRQNDILPNIDKVVKSYKKVIKNPVVKSIMDMDETQEQLDFVQSHKRIPVTLTVSDDLISRQEAKAYLYDRINRLEDNELYDIFSKIIDDMVNELPSVKPQTGHWIDDTDKRAWKCSECGWWYRDWKRHNFCSYCGARMDQEPCDVSDINDGKMSENPTGSKDVIWYSKRNYSEIVVERT